MQSYSATQNTIAAASSKVVCWLLTVVTTASITYRWSLVVKTFAAQNYTAKIIAGTFSGINLLASESEHGIQAPNTLSFQITNATNALTASDFLDASVKVDLIIPIDLIRISEAGDTRISEAGDTRVLEDGNALMGTWKFNVKRCETEQQKLKFECEDFIQQHLKGDWPNTTLVKDAFLSNDSVDENLCIPVPIGNPFIPLESVLHGGNRYYLLGPATGKTYAISKVRSPRKMGYKHDWSSGSFTFTQSSITGLDGISYRVFLALIAEAGTHGLFQDGDSFLSLPTKFTRDDTRQINGSETGTHGEVSNAAILTDTGATWGVDQLIGAYVVNVTDGSYAKITDNTATTVTAALAGGTDNDWDIGDSYVIGGPVSVIRWILIDFGVSSSDIDDTTFAIAEKTFAGWGLVWNGAFIKKQSKKTILPFLLNQCNAYLVIREKICLFAYSKTSQKTLTDADITKPQDIGPASFRTTRLQRIDQDSGFIEWQPADEIQDEWQKVKVSAKFSSGTHDGLANAAVLTDTTKNWPVNSLVGGTAKNTTDVSSTTITANTVHTVTGVLSGGTDNDWDIGDVYTIDVCNNISDEALPVHFIQDSQDGQRAGILPFGRKFLAKSQITFNSKATLLMLEPGDVATINEADYGGTYKFLIKSIQIKEDIAMSFTGKTYDN